MKNEIKDLVRFEKIGNKTTPGNGRNWHAIDRVSGKNLGPNFRGTSEEDSFKRLEDTVNAMGMDKFRNFLQSKSGPERAYKNGQKVVLRDKEGVFKVVHGEKDSKGWIYLLQNEALDNFSVCESDIAPFIK